MTLFGDGKTPYIISKCQPLQTIKTYTLAILSQVPLYQQNLSSVNKYAYHPTPWTFVSSIICYKLIQTATVNKLLTK